MRQGLAFEEGRWKKVTISVLVGVSCREGTTNRPTRGAQLVSTKSEYMIVKQAAVHQNMVEKIGIALRRTKVR